MKRREFLGVTLAAALGACRRAKTREEVLSALVREVVTPEVVEVAATSRELERAITRFTGAPELAALRSARKDWHYALVAWKRAECFRAGPMLETHALVRGAFWPARAAAIEPILAASTPLDAAYINELAVNARGIYAIEYLLFPLELDESATVLRFAGENASRRRSYLQKIAYSLAEYADLAARELGDGSAFAARFAGEGQKSLSALVAQIITTIEKLSAQRLDLVLRLEQRGMLQPNEVEGWPSGSSHEIVANQFLTSQELYEGGSGGGIADLTRAAAPAIAERVAERFKVARKAVLALDAPLERLVKTKRAAVEGASAATKALEITMKTELTSALGLTLTFQSTDGD